MLVCACVQEFWGAAALGSWLTVARQSSHTGFLNAGPLLNRVIAALCGCRGRNSPQACAACLVQHAATSHPTGHASGHPRVWCMTTGATWGCAQYAHCLMQPAGAPAQINASAVAQETLRLTAPPLLAWMESHLRRGDAAAEARVHSFRQWAEGEEDAGTVTITIKEGQYNGVARVVAVPSPIIYGKELLKEVADVMVIFSICQASFEAQVLYGCRW